MILTESEISEHSIRKLVGNATAFEIKNPTPIGVGGFYLKSFNEKSGSVEPMNPNSKGSLEKRENGILIRLNFNNKQKAIPIPFESFMKVELVRGKERISPYLFSPMWFLLKFGVSILKARYFRIYIGEYHIEEMLLKLETLEYDMVFSANGYQFEEKLKFIEGTSLVDKTFTKINA